MTISGSLQVGPQPNSEPFLACPTKNSPPSNYTGAVPDMFCQPLLPPSVSHSGLFLQEPTTFFSLHHLFPKIWPEGRVAMGMATCKKLKSELRDLLVDCFPKTHEEWVEEFQHELDIMRQNVPGKRVSCRPSAARISVSFARFAKSQTQPFSLHLHPTQLNA